MGISKLAYSMKLKSALCTVLIFFSLLVLLPATQSIGQSAPKAVLVQLNAEWNRISRARELHMANKEAEISADAAMVRQKMMADFKDNFRYCPIYFYLDTNAARIKAGQRTGLLMDANGATIAGDPLAQIGGDYLVVFYGKPDWQIKPGTIETDNRDNPGATSNAVGLVICNSNLEQVSYLYKMKYGMPLSKVRSPYLFISKKYEIEYFPFAKYFNTSLRRNPVKIRVRKIF